jgi:eukaryotic-like serine/threonine-protein kinase
MDGRVLAREPGDPRWLGPYELLGRLGQGGMGVVFLGRERRTGRLAAVKALRPELAGDPAFAARFRREVDAARRVDSPQVARVLDADPTATRPWLATEYVDGAALAATVAAGPLTGERLVGFAAGVARALTAVHAAGVVHRDLKASNVLLQPARGVKVIDFGIAWAADATMTRSGPRFGTPSWMAPEQLRDRPAGPPADVFAWGLLVAFAATGRHPFGGGPSDAVAYRILHAQPDLADVPEPLRRLVRDALSRDPAARPAAARLATTLTAALPPTLPLPATEPTRVLAIAGGAGTGTGTHGMVAAGPTRRPRRRRVGRLLVALALLAGLVSAPHVVLAAVAGPDDPATQQSGKHCPGDHEDADARDPDEHEEETDEDEAEDEDEAGEASTRPRPLPTRQGPPSTRPPAPPGPGPEPATPVLGS